MDILYAAAAAAAAAAVVLLQWCSKGSKGSKGSKVGVDRSMGVDKMTQNESNLPTNTI